MYRLIDTNINRISEAFRVLEDLARFKYNSKNISKELKGLRHLVRENSPNDKLLLNSRDSINDFGPAMTRELDIHRNKNVQSLIYGNFKRIQEGARTLEELGKCACSDIDSAFFEGIRYKSYQLEKDFIPYIETEVVSLPPLYGITYKGKSSKLDNVDMVKQMISGGIKLIQYREKNLTLNEMLKECFTIRELTRSAGVSFIVNDHIDIALIVNADGVHIGQDDLDVKYVRELIGNKKFIGVSTHEPEQALKAQSDGANYIGVGPILTTKTKVNVCAPVGYDYLKWVVKNIKIPFVAIGGIKEHNMMSILNAGANSIAIVSDITCCNNIPKKIKRINKIIEEYKNEL